MKALDMFCGGGGASIGLHQAGFDMIVGIDIEPHPNYPFDFIQADVLNLPLDIMDFDFVWASPPCQRYSQASMCKIGLRDNYPDLIPDVRRLLYDHPFSVIENVPLAPIRPDVVLTGKSVGLNRIKRKRHFETSFMMYYPDPVYPTRKEWKTGRILTVSKAMYNSSQYFRRKELGLPNPPELSDIKDAMGIPDKYEMTQAELGKSVPPAYSRYIATEALRQIQQRRHPVTTT